MVAALSRYTLLDMVDLCGAKIKKLGEKAEAKAKAKAGFRLKAIGKLYLPRLCRLIATAL